LPIRDLDAACEDSVRVDDGLRANDYVVADERVAEHGAGAYRHIVPQEAALYYGALTYDTPATEDGARDRGLVGNRGVSTYA
jgi:hypothetical protein